MTDTISEDASEPCGSIDARRNEKPVVLAVDDEQRVTQAFELWLDDYEVRTATGGEEALEKLDESVDVVLLDRQMPGLSGDEVLERIRDRGYDCRVAMVTGVDPDFEIVEMPFDDYVRKPVDQDSLQSVVDRLLEIDDYDDRLREYFSTARKQATLEAEKPRSRLAESEEYAELVDRRKQLQNEVDDRIAEMDPDQVTTVLRQLPDEEDDGALE
jgi:CheY-like chemotaxis protein